MLKVILYWSIEEIQNKHSVLFSIKKSIKVPKIWCKTALMITFEKK